MERREEKRRRLRARSGASRRVRLEGFWGASSVETEGRRLVAPDEVVGVSWACGGCASEMSSCVVGAISSDFCAGVSSCDSAAAASVASAAAGMTTADATCGLQRVNAGT